MVRGLHAPILSAAECADSVSVMSASTPPSIFITFIWKNRKCLTSCQLFTFYFCPIWEFSYYCFGITITGSMNEKNWFYSLLTSEIISIVKQFYFHFLNCSKNLLWSLRKVCIGQFIRCSLWYFNVGQMFWYIRPWTVETGWSWYDRDTNRSILTFTL